jgi:hypothetical protein
VVGRDRSIERPEQNPAAFAKASAPRATEASKMELAAVGVRDDRFELAARSPDRHHLARCHAGWQRLHRRRNGVIAGFAIPY